MNVPKFIRNKGPYYLHKRYGLSKGSLSLWKNKSEDWEPSPLVRLAFERIEQLENGASSLNYKNRAMTLEEITKFCEQNRVEIAKQEDTQLHCFINFLTGAGSYAHGTNAIEVMQQAIKRYLETKSS